MKRIPLLLCALGFCLANDTIAQNDIDYVNSFYWSGYGKMAIDHDTLYLNSMNGAGTERYYIADPANPQYIDRTHVSGFDQIDFERRIMMDIQPDRVKLVDISNYGNSVVRSVIYLQSHLKNNGTRLIGDYLFLATEDDVLRSFDISDPSFPQFADSIGFPSSMIVLGTTKAFAHYWALFPEDTYCLNVYDISNPYNLLLNHIDTVGLYMADHSIYPANGDTIADRHFSIIGGTDFRFFDYPEYLYGDYGYYILYLYKNNRNGYIISETEVVSLNSFNNWQRIGLLSNNAIFSEFNFELYLNHYMIYSTADSLKIFQANQPSDYLSEIFSYLPPHRGILSTAAYGNYILSGAESNGGELLVHELGQNGQLSLIAALPGVPARELIIDSPYALALCPNKIAQIDLTNPAQPAIRYEITSGLSGLQEFELSDTLLYAMGPHALHVIDYDRQSGFAMIGQVVNLSDTFESFAVRDSLVFLLLDDTLNTIQKFSFADPDNPAVRYQKRLYNFACEHVELLDNTLWAFGPGGARVLDIFGEMGDLAFFGPDYFSDTRQARISGESLYVADGVNGIKIFTFQGDPVSGLHYAGDYQTGNAIRNVTTINDNFFLADYYSLHHLRWGAPTGNPSENETGLPSDIALLYNYPNPFNAQTTIEFALALPGDVKLDVFDILGRQVAILFDGAVNAGRHKVVWDAGGLPSGVYFYRLSMDRISSVNRCVFLK